MLSQEPQRNGRQNLYSSQKRVTIKPRNGCGGKVKMQEKKHKVGEEKGCDRVLQRARTKDESGGAQLPTSRCCSKGLF